MDKDDIIKLAREAQGTPYVNRHYPGLTSFGFSETTLAVFAALVADAEREACAALCKWRTGVQQVDAAIDTCAAAIRARSNP